MSAATEIDTLIAELQAARAEGATMVLLQVNGAEGSYRDRPAQARGARLGWQATPQFAFHDPNIIGAYVIGGERLLAADWILVDESGEGRSR